MKRRRILLITHEQLVPPESIEGLTDKEIDPFRTEYDVYATLYNLGHKVRALGISVGRAGRPPDRSTPDASCE